MSELGIRKCMRKALYESKDFGLKMHMEKEYTFPSGLQKDREKIGGYDWGVPDEWGNRLSGNTSDDFEKYRTVSPDRFHELGFGTCWDFIEAQREAYEKAGYGVKTFYIELDNDEKASHTILLGERMK